MAPAHLRQQPALAARSRSADISGSADAQCHAHRHPGVLMTVIKLPKTPKSAFNPLRPASALLLSQIEHLEHAVGLEPKRVKRTEGDAARYIAKLTAELLKQAQTPAAPAPSPLAGTVPVAASPSPTVTQPVVPARRYRSAPRR